MQRLKGRNIVFGALAVLACSGDPTGNESTPTAIQSNPDVVFVTQGDSEPVVVTVLDEDGNVLQADVTASDIGGGITVRLDPTYQEVTTGNPIKRGSRFFVKGVDLAQTSFKVNALGLTKTIEVTSVPGELDAEITDSLPTLGDTVTITAPTGTFFTDSSVLTFNGAAPVVTAQTETTISFIPMPNIFGPALVSNVGVASNPAVVFGLATPFNVKTDSIVDIGTGLSTTAPLLGAPVTLTLPAGLKLIPESLVTLNVAGAGILPINRTLSADSTVITFTPPPNADSFVVVSGVIPTTLAGCCATVANYPLLLGTTVKITTPLIDSLPSTVTPTLTPAANDEVTVTVTDAAFVLDDTANVVIGSAPVTLISKTANSITFVPPPNATGGVTVNGVTIGGFSLALPSQAGSLTVGAVTPLGGTTNSASAPTLAVPGAGEITTIFDQPDFPAADDPIVGIFGLGPTAFYKIVVPANGDYTITVNWDIGSDIDLFVCGDPIDNVGLGNCAFDAATGNQPESATYSLTAGTYNLVVNDFGTDATGATVQITIAH